MTHLVRPRMIWLCIPHDDQSEHGTAIEDPSSKTEEVDQGIDRSIAHHCTCNQTLWKIERDQKGLIKDPQSHTPFLSIGKTIYMEYQSRSGGQSSDVHVGQDVQ